MKFMIKVDDRAPILVEAESKADALAEAKSALRLKRKTLEAECFRVALANLPTFLVLADDAGAAKRAYAEHFGVVKSRHPFRIEAAGPKATGEAPTEPEEPKGEPTDGEASS